MLIRRWFVASILVLAINCNANATEQQEWVTTHPLTVRTAVIGGMTATTGLWDEIIRMFEEDTPYTVEVVVTGRVDEVAQAMADGLVDLATMHQADITTDVVADGYAIQMRPWTRNEHVIYGPETDPAGIRGLDDGAEAFTRIRDTESNFVDLLSLGARKTADKLWARAGIQPMGDWYLKDEHVGNRNILRFAQQQNAYIIIGRIPVIFERQLPAVGMEILVDTDTTMRRPYVVMEANPWVFPDTNFVGARKLSNYLLSDKVQNFLSTFDGTIDDGVPLFYPIR